MNRLLSFFLGGVALFVSIDVVFGHEPDVFEQLESYPLMGDWEGRWIGPTRGHEANHPELAAQLLPMSDGYYRVAFYPELYVRSEPYLDVIVPGDHQRIEVKKNGFQVVFEGDRIRGTAILHGEEVEFELSKVTNLSPTLGKVAPEGAVVLFDGSTVENWQHLDDRPFSWTLRDDILEVNSEFWNRPENKEKGIGGLIGTKKTFKDFHLHLEFRYPVEQGKLGQDRGNSGVFLHPIGEVQILNSYMTAGYYDECGAIYRKVPAKVNAAGPPLQWQTYDIHVSFPSDQAGYCLLTVSLNGHIVHNQLSLPASSDEVRILLQDHINRIQFRNIWLLEK